MNAPTFTKSGSKSSVQLKLNPKFFGVKDSNNEIIKFTYDAHLANSRINRAKTLKRGEVRGGGRKPWRQKGTGRARFGSSRNPIWRGGGITFGPLGIENYSKKVNKKVKQSALIHALSLKSSTVVVLESADQFTKKTKSAQEVISKIGAKGKVLVVRENTINTELLGLRNIQSVKVVSANHLNTNDVIDSDTIIFTKTSYSDLEKRLEGVGVNNE